MKKLIISMISILLFALPAQADEVQDVEVLLKGKLNAVMQVLQNKSLAKEDRQAEILEIVTDVFDFPKMAKLSLGRKYWPGLTKEERVRFSKLFTTRIKASYLEKLELYEDEKIVYHPPLKKKKKVSMMTELISGDSIFTMRYKLYRSKTRGWQIYDIELEGVSLITTYRSQFNEVLVSGTIQDLFEKLKRPDGM